MNAYLIDPVAETVTEVAYDGDYRSIYPLIQAECFDVASVESNGDAVYVDDEGLLNLTPATKFFWYGGYHSPLCGRGLMLGTDEEGNSVAPVTSIETVRQKIRFLTLDQVRRMV